MSETLRMRRTSRSGTQNVSTPVLGGVLALMLAAVAAYYALDPRPPQLDARGCAVDAPLPATSYVMVDTTDPLTPNQGAAVARLLEDESASLPAGGLLSVAALGQSWNGLWSPVLEACRPPRTVAESRGGATERNIERAYRQMFQPKLDKLAEAMRSAREAQSSPVFEAVAVAAAAERKADTAGSRRLVLVTDALESVPGFLEAANARLMPHSVALPFFQHIGADLSGLRVSVFYLQRPRAVRLQTPGHRDFVAAWLRSRGATVDQFVTLPP